MPHKEYKNWGSVTQILNMYNKPALNNWRARLGIKAADKISSAAMKIGTSFHAVIEARLRDEYGPKHTKQVGKMVGSFFEKCPVLKNRRQFVAIEPHLISTKYQFHGSPDLIDNTGNEWWVFDWKSSSAMQRTYGIQLAAYSLMDQQEIDGVIVPCSWEVGDILKGLIVRTDKKAPHKTEIKVFDLLKYQKLFLELKDLWDFEHKRGIYAG